MFGTFRVQGFDWCQPSRIVERVLGMALGSESKRDF